MLHNCVVSLISNSVEDEIARSFAAVPPYVVSADCTSDVDNQRHVQLIDRLVRAVDVARQAIYETGETDVGPYVGIEDAGLTSRVHVFETTLPGYPGWRWNVVVCGCSEIERVTVSEVTLVPGPDALKIPDWLPWADRIFPGELSPGDVVASGVDDRRLVAQYISWDDSGSADLDLSRERVLSQYGRSSVAGRWLHSEYGPSAAMARASEFSCGSCGFYISLSGPLQLMFGVCSNEISADAHVVSSGYGCGAHSQVADPNSGAGTPEFRPYDYEEVVMIASGMRKYAPRKYRRRKTTREGSSARIN